MLKITDESVAENETCVAATVRRSKDAKAKKKIKQIILGF
jgi:hypothetical protein